MISNFEFGNAIVIGFVGGFVRRDDDRHPEVQFAAYLRDRYRSAVHAEVFGNHQGNEALHRVLKLLDVNADGRLTQSEKEQATVIIYGHSWGASEAVTLARELGHLGIPVLLTVQIDSVRKSGQNDSSIPNNVRTAVNFYQIKGLIHGNPTIRSEDNSQTRIAGNFRMSYDGRQIDLSHCRWIARLFNKPHLQIENDPRVWDQVASLIDSTLSGVVLARNRTSTVPSAISK